MLSAVRDEYFRRGYLKTLIVPVALPVGGFVQYDRDSAEIRPIRRQFGIMNTITITNQSDAAIKVRPDYTDGRAIVVPSGTIIGRDSVSFQEFDILNIDAIESADANTISVVYGFEPPAIKDYRAGEGARRRRL